jgi:ribulose-5-phosphate 4-epimerase/fuculose-1-phosphate aldolase
MLMAKILWHGPARGGITDRSIEHLGTTDKGIILYRKLVQQFSIGIPVFPRSILISEPELAASMIEFMGQKDICLLRGHGVSVTGRTVEEATVRALNFNALARVTLQVAQSGREANDISLQDREALPDLGSIFNTTWVWRYYVRLVEACKTPRNYWI